MSDKENDEPTADSSARKADTTTESTTGSSTTTADAADPTAATTGTRADSSASTSGSADAAEAERGTASGRFAGFRPAALGRGGRIAARSAAALALAAAVGSSIFFYLQDRDKQDLLTAQREARETACAYGPVLSTYDAKNLDQYVKGVQAGATGEWKKQFETTSRDLADVLAKGEVVAKTDDVQCALRSADKTSAEAIVVMGQTITSLGTKGQPQKGQLSVVMRLEKGGDRWLVNKIDTPLLPPQP
ncbi:hypothetical protein [Nocardia wallacei]|uniref:hypothetical protein n=1 Tax=Nocardia wallacei TaxID=480035 RepID=UPI0024567E68|nr:hypothetical protein [Nocardia wallacei]